MRKEPGPRAITKAVAAGVVTGLIASPVLAEKASELTYINGSLGSDAETQLRDRGFAHVSTHKYDMGYVYSYWWGPSDGDCVNVEVYDSAILVEVAKPDASKRAIFFNGTTPYDADSAEADGSAGWDSKHTRDGDRVTITYGPETYVIVDALIEGG